MEEEVQRSEPKIRFNVKQNAKREMYFEYTVRGDTVEEVKKTSSEVQKLALERTGQI